MSTEIKKAVNQLALALSNDNLTDYAKENNLDYSTSAGCILSSIAFSLTSQIKYKSLQVAERISEIRAMIVSSNANDTHESILQGRIDWNTCDEVTIQECEEMLHEIKNQYQELIGTEWKVPVKKSDKELLNKNSTSGRFDAIQLLMKNGIELNEKEQALWDNFQVSENAKPSK